MPAFSRHPHSARTNLNVGAESTATPARSAPASESASCLRFGNNNHYNSLRLNSAIGYITPKDMLAGRRQEIHAERDRKLEEVRNSGRFVGSRLREERRSPGLRAAEASDEVNYLWNSVCVESLAEAFWATVRHAHLLSSGQAGEH